MIIQRRFNIGMHVQKKPSLITTLELLNELQPFQIFLGNPSSAKLSIPETELTKAAIVMGKKEFIFILHILLIFVKMDYETKHLLHLWTFKTPIFQHKKFNNLY